MVKCRNHPHEQGVGVCAPCLRERLLAVIAAQTGGSQSCCPAQPQKQQQKGKRKEKQTPPSSSSFLFPRSVSPYIPHGRSADVDFLSETDGRGPQCQRLRFYSTPQVGHAGGGTKGGGAGFSIFSTLFGGGGRRFRSEDSEQDSVPSSSGTRPVSWFAALVAGGKKKKDAKHSAAEMMEEDCARRMCRRKRREWCQDRGMSPEGDVSCGEDASDSDSGYLTESPTNQWRRPEPTPSRKPATSAHSTMSGFAFCLSPLVRATPRRSHVADVNGVDPRGGLPKRGLCRGQHRHRFASAAGGPPSLRPNRSRKLVDFGRYR